MSVTKCPECRTEITDTDWFYSRNLFDPEGEQIYEYIVQSAEEKVAIYGHTGPWNVRKFSPNKIEGNATIYTYAIYGE